MSMTTALDELRTANTALQQTIAELMMTALEDRPRGSEIAAVDDLVETISELQASAAEAGTVLSVIADSRELPAAMPRVGAAIADCTLRYWRDLRSHQATAGLRATARRRGTEWRTWQRSLEDSELRCEAPLLRSVESVQLAWREIGELLCLYLPHVSEHSAQVSASAATMSARRPS
jgi:hypothetical protein